MADIKQYNNIRFANLIDEPNRWKTTSFVPANGEFVVLDDRDNTAIVIGDGSTSIATMIENKNNYASRFFYNSKQSGSGGGGTSSLPTASATVKGGIKVKSAAQSGLKMSGEFLSNALISGYDTTKQCFWIEKLYVKDLSYDSKDISNGFAGSTIILRDGATSAATEPAGIVVTKLQNSFDGFLGLNTNNFITLKDTSGGYVSGVLLPVTKGSGFVTIGNSNIATVTKPGTLTFNNGLGQTEVYDPTNAGDTAITVQFPSIVVNGQNIGISDGKYTIELSGGLTPDNAEKIGKIDGIDNRLKTLETNAITDAAGQTQQIKITRENGKITVSHEGADIKRDPNADPTTTAKAPIPVYVAHHEDTVTVTVLGDIVLDDCGHVIQKQYKQLEIYLPL